MPQEQPHSLLYTPAYTNLGYGLPASIGARVGAPDRPVVCVIGVDLVQPDWALLATAFGGTGTKIDDVAGLGPAIRGALAEGGAQLIHVPMGLFDEA